MAIALEIVPLSDSLDMYGAPDRSSAYSLSGYVSISLHSTSSFFDPKRRPVRTTLQSLTLTFEGQSELLTPDFGYCPLRLYSVTRELAPSEPLDLTNEGVEDSDEPCAWNVVFNLPVPGWLPATSIFGEPQHGDAGVSYALHATATFSNIDDGTGTRSFFSLASLCTPFASKSRAVHAPICPIVVNRYINPPLITGASSPKSLFDTTLFHAHAKPESAAADREEPLVPQAILEKLQVYLRIPEHVSIDDESDIPFSLRMCAEGLTDDECSRLTMSGFHAEVEQTERYRSSVNPQYLHAYAVPPQAAQPPNLPLLNPHPYQSLYEIGLGIEPTNNQSTLRTFSILGPNFSGEFRIAGDDHIFATASSSRGTRRTFTVESTLPFSAGPRDTKRVEALGRHVLRPTSDSPHFSARHTLHVTLACAWDGGAPEPLTFSVPLSFVHTPPAPTTSGAAWSAVPAEATMAALACAEEGAPLLAKPAARSARYALCAPPAYSQLFWSNGERRVEDGLPQYEPPCDLL